MHIVMILFALGAAMMAGGVYAMFAGFEAVLVERSWAQFVGGAVAFSAGAVIAAMALALVEVVRVRRLLARQVKALAKATAVRSEPVVTTQPAPAASEASEDAGAPVVLAPADKPAVAPTQPNDVAVAHAKSAEPPEGVKPYKDLNEATSDVERALSEIIAASVAKPGRPAAAVAVSPPAAAARSQKVEPSRAAPRIEPTRVETLEPGPAISPAAAGGDLALETPTLQPAKPPTSMQPAPLPISEAVRPQKDEPIGQLHDDLANLLAPPPPLPVERGQAPLSPVPPLQTAERQPGDLASIAMPAHPAPFPDTIERLSERAAPSIVRSFVIGGVAYTIYDDGSITADTPAGPRRFESFNELRAFLDSGIAR